MNAKKILEILTEYEEMCTTILSRFSKNKHIHIKDENKVLEIVREVRDILKDELIDYVEPYTLIAKLYNDGISNMTQSPSYYSVESIRSIIKGVIKRIERNPKVLKSMNIDNSISITKQEKLNAIINISNRFPNIVRKLRNRYKDRETIDIEDEYDVQDLYHALLSLHFDDIRPEEFTPSYAGKNSRVDFLLPEIETVVEIKKTRRTLKQAKLGEELLIDIARYKTHPACKTLICFVYDPDGWISNPDGLINDLNKDTEELEVKVIIVPKVTV